MELIPAVDLIDGAVVRLSQGDFERRTVYSHDAVAVARRWAAEGAMRLHLVDLDGARTGRPVQSEVVARIIADAAVPCQVAGGLRDEAAAEATLSLGADRVVMGSALIRDPSLGARLVQRFGAARVVAAVDVRDGRAVGSGWAAEDRGRPFEEVLRQLRDAGVALFAVTAIARDGLLNGPDLSLLDRASEIVGASQVLASAGVSTVADVEALAHRGFSGAILGRALYEGTLTLADALAAASATTART